MPIMYCSIAFSGGIMGYSSSDSIRDEILEYNKETEEWTVIGAMTEPKHRQGVSVVSFADYKEWCN